MSDSTRGGPQPGDAAIARLLRGGVVLATGLLVGALAGSWILDQPLIDRALPLDRLLAGEAGALSTLAQLGLLTLAITPLARVALAAGVFARAGERRHAWTAVGVLVLLLLALLLGATDG